METEWLSKTDKDLLEPAGVASLFKRLWGDADPVRLDSDSKDAKAEAKKAPAVDLDNAPPVYSGVLKAVGVADREPAATLTSFMADSQMRDRVFAQVRYLFSHFVRRSPSLFGNVLLLPFNCTSPLGQYCFGAGILDG